MKKYFLSVISLAFLVWSCAPDSNSANANADTTTATSVTTPDGPPPRTDEPAHVEASVLSPLIGLWEYQSVAGIKDGNIRSQYEGRWIDLKGDQTFTSGIWEEENNSGKWTYDPETKLINFYYKINEGIYDEFETQGVGGLELVFKGNTPRTTRGIQIKMAKTDRRPHQ